QSNSSLGAFAATVSSSEKVLLPGAVAEIESLPAGYLMGPNPPPAVGSIDVPGTFGTVSAHNGEFRTETTDMSLPGRRLGIEFVRAGTGQDLHEGPFGRGWDFNYNQQLIELKPAVFRPGLRMPLVIRGEENSEIADSRDILLQTGSGRNILFKFAGHEPPPEFASDTLVSELSWLDRAESY